MYWVDSFPIHKDPMYLLHYLCDTPNIKTQLRTHILCNSTIKFYGNPGVYYSTYWMCKAWTMTVESKPAGGKLSLRTTKSWHALGVIDKPAKLRIDNEWACLHPLTQSDLADNLRLGLRGVQKRRGSLNFGQFILNTFLDHFVQV